MPSPRQINHLRLDAISWIQSYAEQEPDTLSATYLALTQLSVEERLELLVAVLSVAGQMVNLGDESERVGQPKTSRQVLEALRALFRQELEA